MSGVDDEWTSFLTQGAIILSNEKNSAKNNVTNSYQKNMDSTMTSYTAIIDTHNTTNTVLKPLTSIADSSLAKSMALQKPTFGTGLSKLKSSSKQTINLSSLKKVENNIKSIKSITSTTSTKSKSKSKSNIDDVSDEDCDIEDCDLDDLEEHDIIDLDEFDSKLPDIETVGVDGQEQQPVCRKRDSKAASKAAVL